MAWTSHGHQIPGTDVEHPSPARARCGGVGGCKVCSAEAALFGPKTDQATSSKSQEGPMIDLFEEDLKTDKWEVLENNIRKSINKLSLENEFDIPDYILAQHVVNNLKGLSNTIKLNKERRNG